MIRKAGGIEKILSMIKDPANEQQNKLLKYCTGTAWRLSASLDNLVYIHKGSLVPSLVRLLNHHNVTVSPSYFVYGFQFKKEI
jgi:hypothetical protein